MQTAVNHPEWSKSATIYQINTRQFSAAGTLRAAQDQLPRLKDLGVDILWLMPIHEIGRVNRKGLLGSPYAVRDYYSIDENLGTMQELTNFVAAAHELGLFVIIDWVANHTAWDCNLVDEHPDWYTRDYQGDFRPTPWWDWEDIIDLDYSHEELHDYMIGALSYWVREADIDGFRCDVAGFVPNRFWARARRELDAIKPIFMLAEWETRDMHFEAFDMTYAWSWNEAVHRLATGKAGLDALHVYYAWNEKAWPRDAIRMIFVSNHDKNAWDGTEFEQFGASLDAAVVLSVVGEGMPLIYNGQEAGNDRRLNFFDRDPIVWRDHPAGDLYRRLFALKHSNSALWNGAWGARMIKVRNGADDVVLSFVRANDEDKVFAVFNFSGFVQDVTFAETICHGTYLDFESDREVHVDGVTRLGLQPWSWVVLTTPKLDQREISTVTSSTPAVLR